MTDKLMCWSVAGGRDYWQEGVDTASDSELLDEVEARLVQNLGPLHLRTKYVKGRQDVASEVLAFIRAFRRRP